MTGYDPPRPSQPRTATPRRSWTVIDLVMILALACLGVAWAILRVTSGPHGATASGGDAGKVPIAGAAAAPTTGAPSAGDPDASAGRRFDVDVIAAAIDPTVVDIVTTLDAGSAHAAGTGIVVTSSGEVLTNNHVIESGTSISVTDVGNGKTYAASVVGYDRSQDLAVIQLRGASGLATAPIGDSSKVATGDTIVAIGNAGGRGGTPTAVAGTVSGLDQTITATDAGGSNAERLTGLIQMTADIEPGDSGGPLVDSSARVVGVVAAGTASHGPVASGTGFAIPISHAIAVARQIEAGQGSDTVHIGTTAFLGVTVGTASQGSGVVITDVTAGSPADRAGLRPGDRIASIDAIPVDSASTLFALLVPHHPRDQVTVSLVGRGGRVRRVTVRLATGPPV